MPHCVIEHSADIDGKTLVSLVYKGALESNLFELNFKNLARGAEDKKITKRSFGMLPGAGMLYKLNDSILLGLEYSLAVLKEIKTNPGSSITSIYSPSENSVSANVRWIF